MLTYKSVFLMITAGGSAAPVCSVYSRKLTGYLMSRSKQVAIE